MPVEALELVVWVCAGVLVVGSAWRWMCRRVDAADERRARERAHHRAARFRQLEQSWKERP